MKKIKLNSEIKNSNELPFDVTNNYKLFQKQIGHNDESLMCWVKTQPNFKGVIPFHFTPIVENQKQYDSYKIDIDEDVFFISKNDVSNIPLELVEIITDKECKITSITLIVNQKDKLFKVITQKDYGVIKSRYQIDSKGLFKNYEKCDLVPYEGEYKEYRFNNNRYGRSELNKVFNYKNGIKHGECRTYYKGDYPFYILKDNSDTKFYWYEMFTFNLGKKEGLYENTKNLERGNIFKGKRVGEWIVEPPKDTHIPNFNQKNNRSYGMEDLDRIKCSFIDSKLDGKWEGVSFNDFFGIKSKFENLRKVGGEFVDGKLNGEFYSEFWNNNFFVVRGKYENNIKIGKWIYKINNNLSSNEKFTINDFPKGKNWYIFDRINNEEKYYSNDEVVDFNLETYHFGGKSNNDLLYTKIETILNNEIVEIKVIDDSEKRKSFNLTKGQSPFSQFTEIYIPNEYQNLGFSLTHFEGWVSVKNKELYHQIKVNSENVFGYDEINEQLLLQNGYSFTKVGKDRYDRRKTKTYPSLPSNYNDFYGMGEFQTLDIEIGYEPFKKIVFINNKLFEFDNNKESKTSIKLKEEKQYLIKEIVDLLINEKLKELNCQKTKLTKEFSFFPMD